MWMDEYKKKEETFSSKTEWKHHQLAHGTSGQKFFHPRKHRPATIKAILHELSRALIKLSIKSLLCRYVGHRISLPGGMFAWVLMASEVTTWQFRSMSASSLRIPFNCLRISPLKWFDGHLMVIEVPISVVHKYDLWNNFIDLKPAAIWLFVTISNQKFKLLYMTSPAIKLKWTITILLFDITKWCSFHVISI